MGWVDGVGWDVGHAVWGISGYWGDDGKGRLGIVLVCLGGSVGVWVWVWRRRGLRSVGLVSVLGFLSVNLVGFAQKIIILNARNQVKLELDLCIIIL